MIPTVDILSRMNSIIAMAAADTSAYSLFVNMTRIINVLQKDSICTLLRWMQNEIDVVNGECEPLTE